MPRSGRRVEKSSFAPQYLVFLALLKREREERGLSQRELGRRLGRHHNFVSSCEMGDRTLNFVEVRAWILGLGLDWVEFTRKVDQALAAQSAPPNGSSIPPGNTPPETASTDKADS